MRDEGVDDEVIGVFVEDEKSIWGDAATAHKQVPPFIFDKGLDVYASWVGLDIISYGGKLGV